MTGLHLQQAQCRYDQAVALHPVDLAFEPGQLTALVGPNGAGKSSLLRICAGLADPAPGQVRLDGVDIAAMAPAVRARHIGFLPADGRSAWPMTVRRIIGLGRTPHLKPLRSFTPEDEAAIDTAMRDTETEHLAERRFDTLSSGERARVLLARVLATQADMLVLDEPTAALDPRHQLAVMEIAKSAARSGRIVLVAAHALDLVAHYADRVLLMSQGRVMADGPPAQSLDEDRVREVFGVEAPGGIEPTGMRLPG